MGRRFYPEQPLLEGKPRVRERDAGEVHVS
jgi:hypothetical protein